MPKLDSHETKTAFATRVGLTKGRISQLVAEGLPVRADGRIDVAVGLAWIEDNLDPARRNKGGAVNPTRATTTLAEAKRLHEIVKVQRAKLAFEREQGQLVETAAATRTVFARARAERDAHLAWVQRTAPLLAAELGADPRATFAALDRMMREHLEHLADLPLRPFSVAHVEQPWRRPHTSGDLTIRWTRRSRALAADSWGGLEVPLGEELEAYEVEILDGGRRSA